MKKFHNSTIELNSKTNRQGFQLVHGEARKTKEYNIWSKMKSRCLNTNDKSFHDYGGRGITVCDSWSCSYSNFLHDMGRAPSPKHSIERIENDKGYSPDNCKWATRIEQANNTRVNRFVEYKGQTKTLSEWCRELNLNYDMVEGRLNKWKWNIIDAFEIPRYGKNRKHWGRTPK